MAITRDSGKAGTTKKSSSSGGLFGPSGGTPGSNPLYKDNRTYSPYVSKPASTASTPINNTPPPPPPPPVYYGGGGGGGGFAAAAAPAVAPPPPPPPPMTDIDWFNKDSVFRNQATIASNDLVDQLAELLYQRGQGFQGVDNMRRDWTRNRDDDVEAIGEDFASRGLNSSGMYRRGYDDLMGQYERQAGDINQNENDLIQQFGKRDSLQGGIDRSQLIGDNYNALASIYGLLGSRGVQAGNAYSGRIQGLRGESAGRANQELVKTLNW